MGFLSRILNGIGAAFTSPAPPRRSQRSAFRRLGFEGLGGAGHLNRTYRPVFESLEPRAMLVSTVSLGLLDPIATEGTPATDVAQVELIATPAPTVNLNVFLALSGTASPTSDYSAPSMVTIPAGQSSVIITISAIDDGLPEGDETATFTLQPDANYIRGPPTSATIILVDNDASMTVSIVANDPDAYEAGLDPGQFRISRSGPTVSPLTVAFTVSGDATPGADYVAISPPNVLIPVGATSAHVTVTPIQDAFAEPLEFVRLTIAAPSGYSVIGPDYAEVAINDNEVTGEHVVSDMPLDCDCACSCLDTTYSESLLTGGLKVVHDVMDWFSVTYNTVTEGRPLVRVHAAVSPEAAFPTTIRAQLTVGGLVAPMVYYNPAGMLPGDLLRFVLRPEPNVLPTGYYAWNMGVSFDYASAPSSTAYFTGEMPIINRNQSEFGRNAWIKELDRMYYGYNGALHVTGDGAAMWWRVEEGQYMRPLGEPGFSTLVGFSGRMLTAKDGSVNCRPSRNLCQSGMLNR